MIRNSRHLALTAAITLALLALTPAFGAEPTIWQDLDEKALTVAPGDRLIVPERYRTVLLDFAALKSVLARAPMEFTGGMEAVVTLPMPDGTLARFRVEESPIMEPGLAGRYPDVKTYRGQGVDDPAASTRFGVTPAGFHAIVLSPAGTVYVDAYSRGDLEHYVSYYKRDFRKAAAASFECAVHGKGDPVGTLRGAVTAAKFSGLSSGGGTLRTYRLAQAANFEYTLFHSGGVPNLPDKQAAITNGIIPTINRVNAIYERELAVHMNLIDNLEDIVWDQPADPYVNEEGTSMLVANQVTLDAIVGNANYDIGHVFSTGGGGIAGLGVVCDDSPEPLNQKAWGVTGLPAPVGDPFDVDFVAHEMGHQFGGNHTFNGNAGNCSGGNRNAATAYEVGSGSTIQAYAGICGSQNLQPHSDDYFHNISYVEMRAHVTSGPADATGLCATATVTVDVQPCIGEDDDDFDDDGKRDDEDSDDDSDGKKDDEDSDDDSDGKKDDEDSDDDNDCIPDELDSESAREQQSLSSRQAAPGESHDSTLTAEPGALLLIALAEGPSAELLTVEIYNPAGVLVAVSVPAPGRALATAVPLFAGDYTVRTRNGSGQSVPYRLTLVHRAVW